MKTKLVLLVVLLFTCSSVVAQFTTNSPLHVTRFNHAGTLIWSNQLCPETPVYEIQRASSPTGAWQHHLFVTNSSQVVLSNSLGTAAGAVFHRLALVGDAPMTFNYEYSDGGDFGCVTATGQIRFGLLNSVSNFWQMSVEDFCGGGLHPSGTGVLYGGLTRDSLGNYFVRLRFNNFSEGYFLQGTLHRTNVNGQCVYDRMTGQLYLSGFAGETPLGPFTATRVP